MRILVASHPGPGSPSATRSKARTLRAYSRRERSAKGRPASQRSNCAGISSTLTSSLIRRSSLFVDTAEPRSPYRAEPICRCSGLFDGDDHAEGQPIGHARTAGRRLLDQRKSTGSTIAHNSARATNHRVVMSTSRTRYVLWLFTSETTLLRSFGTFRTTCYTALLDVTRRLNAAERQISLTRRAPAAELLRDRWCKTLRKGAGVWHGSPSGRGDGARRR